MFELGPCRVNEFGHNTTYNPDSWNSHANIIFLDQPVNVGFSYADNGKTVSTSPVAGKDVYAFLELFFHRFSEYSELPFHSESLIARKLCPSCIHSNPNHIVAAESYGGTYAPNIASVVHEANKKLSMAPTPSLKKINLASVILANGLTDPYIQMGSVADYACDGPFPVYSDPEGPECTSLRAKIPTCQRLISSCYKFQSRLTCVPAMLYCNSQLFGPLMRE